MPARTRWVLRGAAVARTVIENYGRTRDARETSGFFFRCSASLSATGAVDDRAALLISILFLGVSFFFTGTAEFHGGAPAIAAIPSSATSRLICGGRGNADGRYRVECAVDKFSMEETEPRRGWRLRRSIFNGSAGTCQLINYGRLRRIIKLTRRGL